MIYPFARYKIGFRPFVMAGMLMLFIAAEVHSQELDYRAQSLYIYKFTKFIQWPEDRSTGDFVIGVFGNSPIIGELQLMASLKKAGVDQDIVVKDVVPDEDLTGYHIIYVPSSKSRQIGALAEQVGNLPVLIVAEREGMATKGATISFLIENYEILKFEVNVARLEAQKLSISEELIKLGYRL